MSTSKTLIAKAVAIACVAVTPLAAVAQSGTSGDTRLEEIVVTATKREQSLQTVPIAVSVLAGSQLEKINLNSMEAISSHIPTVNFRANASNKDTALFIRGVGTISTSPGTEPSVSTVVDGVVFGRAGMATLDLMDVARLEVLRGPQGTLFGKNASAGVINVVSKPISDETQAFVDIGWYEGNERRIRGGISGQLSDGVRGSLNVLSGEFDGVVKNVFLKRDVQGYDRRGFRGKVDIDVSDNLTASLIVDHMRADDTGTRGPWVRPNASQAAAIAPVVGGFENRSVYTNVLERVEDENQGISAQLDWQVSSGTVTSITAYREWGNIQYQDIDGTAVVNNQIAQLGDKGIVDYSQFSQELRYASPEGETFDYVVGAMYYNSKSDEIYRRDRDQCNGTLANLPNGLTPCAAVTTGFGRADYGTELESLAAFGEGTVRFGNGLRGIAGIRYTSDDLSYYHQRTSTFAAAVGGINPTRALVTGSTSESGLSGRLGLQYNFADDVMVYGTYSRGYKGPAYNAFFNMGTTADFPIEKEESDGFELGLKSLLADGRLRLNVALFDTTFKGYQANYPDLVAGVVVTRFINAGDVSTKGVEADFEAQLSANFSLLGSLAYTDATVDKFKCPAGATAAQCNIPGGTRLPFAPEWKANLGVNYGVDVGDMRLDLTLDYTHQSDTQYDLTASLLSIEPSWDIINASLALTGANDRWRLSLIGRNLADESYSTNLLPGGTQRGVPRDDEAYYGIQARFNFGSK
ncbi:MAG: TonB-dependent receptor [Steroidobacteraceae bacterium]|jgi:iron complex outermembrane recepter protein